MASVAKRKRTHNGKRVDTFVVRFTDAAGKRRMRSFDKQADAKAFRGTVESGTAAEVVAAVAPKSVTVEAVCRQFLAAQEDRLRDGRIGQGQAQNYRVALERSIIPSIGPKLMGRVTPLDIEELYGSMTRSGRISPGTAKHRLHYFRLVEEFAIKRGVSDARPAAEFMKELRGVTHKKIRTFTTTEVEAVMQAAQVRRKRQHAHVFALTRCAIHLAACCGLRMGEIMGLTVGCLDLDQRTIHVRHSLTAFGEHKGPKTKAGNRDVPIPAHLADLLAEWVRDHYLDNPEGLIFRTEEGTAIGPTNFRTKYWWPVLKLAGLFNDAGGDQLHFHALRHFYTSYAIANHVPLTDVARLAGHSTFDMTLQVYAHPVTSTDHQRAALDRMAARLLPAVAATMSDHA